MIPQIAWNMQFFPVCTVSCCNITCACSVGLDGVGPPLVQCPRILDKVGLRPFNHIIQVRTMRMSKQAKKILLALLRDHGQERSPRLRGTTLKSMAMQIDGSGAFEAWGNYLKSEKDYSYGRTLKGLMVEGYVEKRRERRGRDLTPEELVLDRMTNSTSIDQRIRDLVVRSWTTKSQGSEIR